jgi:hypothetical protein
MRNFRERRTGEVRITPLLGTWVNKARGRAGAAIKSPGNLYLQPPPPESWRGNPPTRVFAYTAVQLELAKASRSWTGRKVSRLSAAAVSAGSQSATPEADKTPAARQSASPKFCELGLSSLDSLPSTAVCTWWHCPKLPLPEALFLCSVDSTEPPKLVG